jgi:hypothetical protein
MLLRTPCFKELDIRCDDLGLYPATDLTSPLASLCADATRRPHLQMIYPKLSLNCIQCNQEIPDLESVVRPQTSTGGLETKTVEEGSGDVLTRASDESSR